MGVFAWKCTPCTGNTVGKQGSICTACKLGYVAKHNNTVCEPCPAGHKHGSMDDSDCTPCGRYEWSQEASRQCTTCWGWVSEDHTRCWHIFEMLAYAVVILLGIF